MGCERGVGVRLGDGVMRRMVEELLSRADFDCVRFWDCAKRELKPTVYYVLRERFHDDLTVCRSCGDIAHQLRVGPTRVKQWQVAGLRRMVRAYEKEMMS